MVELRRFLEVIAVKLGDINPNALALAAGLGLGLVVLWQLKKAGGALADAVKGGALNPASSNNVAYRATNAVGGAIAGDQNFSIGARFWEFMNPGAAAAEDAAVHGPAPAPVPAVLPTAPSVGPAWASQVKGYQYPTITGF